MQGVWLDVPIILVWGRLRDKSSSHHMYNYIAFVFPLHKDASLCDMNASRLYITFHVVLSCYTNSTAHLLMLPLGYHIYSCER